MQKLKPCPDCGHQVSPTAPTCPKCGASLKGAITTNNANAVFLLLSFIPGFILAFVLSALPGEDAPPTLRVLLGLTGLITPPGIVLVLSSRR
jgi:hypothetical protein